VRCSRELGVVFICAGAGRTRPFSHGKVAFRIPSHLLDNSGEVTDVRTLTKR
jgi:hypothetical protein